MLSVLTYREDAKRQVCLLPLAGIYWDDELPDLRELFKISEDDREQIFRLFGLRCQVWKGEVLGGEDRQFWENMQSLMPTWAFFERHEVTPEDLQAQDDASRSTTEVLQAWFADADEVSVTEKMGVQRFSLKLELTIRRRACLQKTILVGARIPPSPAGNQIISVVEISAFHK